MTRMRTACYAAAVKRLERTRQVTSEYMHVRVAQGLDRTLAEWQHEPFDPEASGRVRLHVEPDEPAPSD